MKFNRIFLALSFLTSLNSMAASDDFDFNLDLNGDYNIESIEVKKWLNEIDAQLVTLARSKSLTLKKKLGFVLVCDLNNDLKLSDQEYQILKLRTSELAVRYNKYFIENFAGDDQILDSSELRKLRIKFRSTIPGIDLKDLSREKPDLKLNSSVDAEYI
jgi:hypothetical protein